MYPVRHTVTIETDADGDGTGYTGVVNGRVLSIQYVKDDYANGVDFDVTGETTGQVIWDQDDVNASVQVAPRQPTHDKAGAASLFAAGGEPVEDYYYVANERIKIVVGSGGDTKSGTFHVVVG